VELWFWTGLAGVCALLQALLLLHLLGQLLEVPLELIDNAEVIVPRGLQDFRLGLAVEERVLQLLAMGAVGGAGLSVLRIQIKSQNGCGSGTGTADLPWQVRNL